MHHARSTHKHTHMRQNSQIALLLLQGCLKKTLEDLEKYLEKDV